MAHTARQVSYTYVTIPNNPGAGQRILAPLAKAGVNLLAVSGFPGKDGKVQLDLVPEDMGALKRVAAKNRWKLAPAKTAFLVSGSDRPGALSHALDLLAKAKVSVIAADAVAAGKGRWAMILWVPKPARAKAAKALGAR